MSKKAKQPETLIERLRAESGFGGGISKLCDDAVTEIERLTAYAERLKGALDGMIGLVQLACARPDMPQDIRQAIADNHRWREATLDALSRNELGRSKDGTISEYAPVRPEAWAKLDPSQSRLGVGSEPPRCALTGNPCGTDTVREGLTCPDKRNDYRCVHSVRTQSDWIPVTERLPEAHQVVIVAGGIGYWLDPRPPYPEGQWMSLTGLEYPGRPIQWNVTHWMPLPDLRLQSRTQP